MSSVATLLHDEKKQGTALAISSNTSGKKVYLESYGCQMNFADSEVVASILIEQGYQITNQIHEAEIIFLNTCAIRDKAEQTIRHRLTALQQNKKHNKKLTIGLLGCMAERMKEKLLEEEKLVDLIAGPDAYKDLPNLLKEVDGGQKAINVILSKEETYGDINPVRLNSNGITAFVSIMRGCDNMCSFCVVPFTRGRERSRSAESIVAEVKQLSESNYKEVTLLGQNVDSYLWFGGGLKKEFAQLTHEQQKSSVNFAQLLALVAEAAPKMRIRFSTSHPKDMSDEVLHTMAKYDNICKYIHLPVQSGSTSVLERMNRGYSQEWYLERIAKIRELMPTCAISTDLIAGFCDETDAEHQETLKLMQNIDYEFAYMYMYSERPNTLAERKMQDNVLPEIKSQRLNDLIVQQRKSSKYRNEKAIGQTFEILIEGESKKSTEHYYGRNTHNAVCVFPKTNHLPGDFVEVRITNCTSATLIGEII